MKTLLEQIKEWNALAGMFRLKNPKCNDIWFSIEDVDIDELRSVAEHFGSTIKYNDVLERMYIDLHRFENCEATIFCYSKKVKVITTTVIETI